jgi:hypothetical protein
MRQISPHATNFVILFSAASLVSLLLGGYNSAFAQNMTNMTIMTNMTNTSSKTMDSHEKHVLDELIISQYIPLERQLTAKDYLLLMDLTPFATSVEGHSHIAVKIPCSEEGIPELTIFSGVAPQLKSLDLGIPISSGMLNGKSLDLSNEGKSCLYHADLPVGITDVGLINTSNRTIDFDTGGYSVTISIHGTAAQHLGANESEK